MIAVGREKEFRINVYGRTTLGCSWGRGSRPQNAEGNIYWVCSKGNKPPELSSHLRLDHSITEALDGALDPAELLQSGFRYALSLVHDSHDAEDLVQDAWLRLSRRYGAVSSRALLFVAIRHACIDRARRRGQRGFIELDETMREITSLTVDTCVAVDLASLLQSLRPIEREALYLHHVEGHTAEEIGSLLRTPRNTVLSLLNRALKKLQMMQKD